MSKINLERGYDAPPKNDGSCGFEIKLVTKCDFQVGLDRTSFILKAASRKAKHVLLDHRHFQLEEESFRAFEKALDEDIENNPCLMNLLQTSPHWESQRS